jgi:soluble lytic murein transglycosylase-like protein
MYLRNMLRHFGWLACLLAGSAVWASELLADGSPEWTDEPPALSRLIEDGYAAQIARKPLLAAAKYCAAARFGSVEAQYRLGRVFLERHDQDGQSQGRAMLALAAQRGHEKARLVLADQPSAEDLPDCLLTGAAPAFEVREAVPLVVPVEVVDRYMLALPRDKQRHAQLIRRLAPRFDVDYRLALAIARAESNLDPSAVSSKNAQGLMQLIPDTAARFGVRNPFDPEQNVRGGLAYLRWLLERFNGNVALASAAYNAGEGAVDKHGGVPPYAETQNYVQRILHFYRSPVHARPGAM